MIAKRIASAALALAPAAWSFLEVVVLLGAVALVSYGAWEIYAPLGPIVAGILIIAGVILRARGG